MPSALLSLPSPASPVAFEAGPLAASYHGLFIALGILGGTWLTALALARRGHDGALALGLLLFVAPLGLVGARAYHGSPSTIGTSADRWRLSSGSGSGASGSMAR